MTKDQVRAVIESCGRGDTLSDKVRDVAGRVGCAEKSLWNYLKSGVPASSGAVRLNLERLRPGRKKS